MIINFDQSPEEYFRLSRIALERKELDRALLYGEKALRGKGSTEYKLSLAEIFLSMGRYTEAVNTALEVLCYGRGMRGETYDILARAAGELGYVYESLHYIAKKARYEGDDDALDAMGEVMQEIASGQEGGEEQELFLVGKEPPKDDGMTVMRANLAMNHGDAAEALLLASEIEPTSDQYVLARLICMRAYIHRKEHAKAIEAAEEIVAADPKRAYALYVLIVKYRKKEYLPLLAGVEGGREDLRYAISAAEEMGEHALADRIADKLLSENPYDGDGYFVAAAVALNNGDRAKSEDILKRLFSLYSRYPAQVILKGWRRLKSCDATFHSGIPAKVQRILRNYIKAHAATRELFERSMLTDEAFRTSVTLLFEERDEEVAGNILSFFGQTRNRHTDAFFAKLLIRVDLDLLLKRAILAQLLFHKEKGRISLVQSVVPMQVSCVKPAHFPKYPQCLKEAYVNVCSFLVAMTDSEGDAVLPALAEKAFTWDRIEKMRPEDIGAAFLYRLLSDDLLPKRGEHGEEAACRFILSFVFGVERVSMERVKRLAGYIGM